MNHRCQSNGRGNPLTGICAFACLIVGWMVSQADSAHGLSHWLVTSPQAVFEVAGHVSTEGKALSAVTVSFERVSGVGSVPAPVTTNTSGAWTQTGFEPRTTYRVIPRAVGFAFRPAALDFNQSNTRLDFEALALIFSASGIVRSAAPIVPVASTTGKPPGIAGVTISFERVSGNGATPSPVTTDASGTWSQTGFRSGTTYRARASKVGRVFSPAGQEFSSGPNVQLEFVGESNVFAASGKVLTADVSRSLPAPDPAPPAFTPPAPDGRGVPGVRISFSRVSGTGAVPEPLVTDEQGRWRQTGFERGTVYRIIPTRLLVDTFTPRSIDTLTSPPPNALSEVGNQDFQITIPKFRASGRVSSKTRGTGIFRVSISFSKVSGGGPVPLAVFTNERGEWSQEGFEAGTAYRVTPTKDAFSFAQGQAGPFSSPAIPLAFNNVGSPGPFRHLTDLDFFVPDTFSIGGRVTTSDSEILSRRPIVTLVIKPSGGSTQRPICVKTPIGVPWSADGLESGTTYEITPEAFDGRFYLFSPSTQNANSQRRNLDFTVRFDPVTIEKFGGSLCTSP